MERCAHLSMLSEAYRRAAEITFKLLTRQCDEQQFELHHDDYQLRRISVLLRRSLYQTPACQNVICKENKKVC